MSINMIVIDHIIRLLVRTSKNVNDACIIYIITNILYNYYNIDIVNNTNMILFIKLCIFIILGIHANYDKKYPSSINTKKSIVYLMTFVMIYNSLQKLHFIVNMIYYMGSMKHFQFNTITVIGMYVEVDIILTVITSVNDIEETYIKYTTFGETFVKLITFLMLTIPCIISCVFCSELYFKKQTDMYLDVLKFIAFWWFSNILPALMFILMNIIFKNINEYLDNNYTETESRYMKEFMRSTINSYIKIYNTTGWIINITCMIVGLKTLSKNEYINTIISNTILPVLILFITVVFFVCQYNLTLMLKIFELLFEPSIGTSEHNNNIVNDIVFNQRSIHENDENEPSIYRFH